jgi:2,5-diketo-D-gluconate reductase B
LYATWVTVQDELIPAVGLGTWELLGSDCRRGVEWALNAGYRHFDTAQGYHNERDVGNAIRRSSVPRESIFLTTKISNKNLEAKDVITSTERSLRKLRTDYVDLLLIHWPARFDILEATLDAMSEVQANDRARHIGVSNFTPRQLARALRCAPILCNQVEYHPYLGQNTLQRMASDEGIMLTAYCPLARGEVMNDAVLIEIAQHHGKSPAQVALRWLLDKELVAVIPKSRSSDHIKANIDVFDFRLTPEESERIDHLECARRLIDPFQLDWSE